MARFIPRVGDVLSTDPDSYNRKEKERYNG